MISYFFFFFIVAQALLLSHCVIDFNHPLPNCSYTRHSTASYHKMPEIFFINMDRSVTRRTKMEQHLQQLGFRYQRVRGIEPRDMYIPTDIMKTWTNRRCMLDTAENFLPRVEVQQNSSHPLNSYSFIISALCGRGKKKNSPKELGCTVSHLHAMHQAVYSETATSDYALIVEDDVLFPFNIDFSQLAASAPSDAAILQLFNSNKPSMKNTWESYMKSFPTKQHLWVRRKMNNFDYWSTCAYLINRKLLKQAIDAVAYYKDGWFQFKVVAGVTTPCVPAACCTDSHPDSFNHVPPCVYAPRGYQADSFLYALAPTYVTTVPIITNGFGGNQSTFHQDHVEMFHRSAFIQQKEFINQMLKGSAPVPAYATAACNNLFI